MQVMLGTRISFHMDSVFSPAEAVYDSQLVLTGQFVNTAESPSPSFLEELQTAMAGLTPPPTLYNSSPALIILPEKFLLARFVLVLCDAVQPPLAPLACWSDRHTFSTCR